MCWRGGGRERAGVNGMAESVTMCVSACMCLLLCVYECVFSRDIQDFKNGNFKNMHETVTLTIFKHDRTTITLSSKPSE